MNTVYVFIGGGVGSLLRYGIGSLMIKTGINPAVGTLISNIFACVIFAIIANYISGKVFEPEVKFLALTGFCGGLSTFSTFGYETFLLLKQQNYFWMTANMIVSIGLCLSCFLLIRK